ncbi:hypothetical protein CPB84DRAFT_295290 [Gymnopilus junonius]|uniref:Uncharacterized protein n=1 Tax=Gymnopilus junonius TaxID=109634 RepID=A0A9P5NSM3_GYMJU|nr:hypothetical protein CPB84DRAFT_295290 [Gymnopilus junonius]
MYSNTWTPGFTILCSCVYLAPSPIRVCTCQALVQLHPTPLRPFHHLHQLVFCIATSNFKFKLNGHGSRNDNLFGSIEYLKTWTFFVARSSLNLLIRIFMRDNISFHLPGARSLCLKCPLLFLAPQSTFSNKSRTFSVHSLDKTKWDMNIRLPHSNGTPESRVVCGIALRFLQSWAR